MIRAFAFVAATAGGLLLAQPSAAQTAANSEPVEIRAAVGLPPTHPVVATGWRTFEETALRQTGNGLRFRIFVNGAVIGASGGLEPLAQGDADIGMVVPARYPDQFPFTGYLTELALCEENGLAAAAAMTEHLLLHCPPCAAEFLDQNLVFLGTYSAAPYLLMSKQPIDSRATMEGRKVRTPGSMWDRWTAALGAHPLQTAEGGDGSRADAVIDVALALGIPATEDGLRFVTDLPFGGYRGASPFTVNRDFWTRLTPAQRGALFSAAAAGLVAATEAYADQAVSALAAASTDSGIGLVAADAELDGLVRGFAEQEGERAAVTARDREGIVDAADMLAVYRELYEKYANLLGAAQSPEQSADILMREIYANLDPGIYATAPAKDGGKVKQP